MKEGRGRENKSRVVSGEVELYLGKIRASEAGTKLGKLLPVVVEIAEPAPKKRVEIVMKKWTRQRTPLGS